MAEVLAGVASVIAVVQLADKVVQYCKYYIDGVRDASTDLRVIVMEMNTLKPIFEYLRFLCESKKHVSAMIGGLARKEGPIAGCESCVTELEALLKTNLPQSLSQTKRRKVEATLASLAWPFKEKKAKKLLEELSRYKTTINLALTMETAKDVETIKDELDEINGKLAQAQRQDVYRWLEHTDPSSLHHRACQLYEPGTGDWILRAPNWRSWIDIKYRCLWVHGIPGAGKTVLMSHLIEHLKDHTRMAAINTPEKTIAYAYYYCYFAHGQNEADPFLRSLLNQLCRRTDQITDKIYIMYKTGGKPSTSDLLDALKEVLQAFDIVYVAIDAVDESNPRGQLLGLLQSLVTDQRLANIQLLVSSREYTDIQRAMSTISRAISMANPYVEEDIKSYVRSLMRRNSRFNNWSQDILEEVTNKISSKARGMFRWAVCQIDALQRIKCDRAVIQRRLQDLPKTLDKTYDRIFAEIEEDERLFVYHVIHWIVSHEELFTDHPNEVRLPCSILIEAAVKSMACENVNYNDRFYNTEVLRELCGCLIQIHVDQGTPSSQYAILAHHTVREYIFSPRFRETPLGLSLVSEAPLEDEFMQMALSTVFDMGYTTRLKTLQSWSSVDVYLSIWVLHHVRKNPGTVIHHGSLGPQFIKLLDPSQDHFAALVSVISTFSRFDFNAEAWGVEWLLPLPNPTVRHFWAILQFDSVLPCNTGGGRSFLLSREFLKRSQAQEDLRSCTVSFRQFGGPLDGTYKGTLVEVCMSRASCYSPAYFALNFLLRHAGGDYDATKILVHLLLIHYRRAYCAKQCFCEIQAVIDAGADVNGGHYIATPLQIATRWSDIKIIKWLLQAGADPNKTGGTQPFDLMSKEWWQNYAQLSGSSPLWLHRRKIGTRPPKDDAAIDACLVQYGARGFSQASPESQQMVLSPRESELFMTTTTMLSVYKVVLKS